MDLPPIEINPRSREFKKYPRDLRESVVMAYLFNGLSTRKLDEFVLGLDSNVSGGYQSMDILHHYGLGVKFKNIFNGMDPDVVLSEFPENPEYDFLYDIISGSGGYHSPDVQVVTMSDVLGFDRKVMASIRVNQGKFREKILNAYHNECCITRISGAAMLIASHIKPWCVCDGIEKLDVRNGLCLNALHDRAFDNGLMTVDPSSLCVRLSSKIEYMMPEDVYDEYFRPYDGMTINLPKNGCEPGQDYLKYHEENVFDKKFNKLRVVYETMIDC